jgi:CIC family chloride channel protein
MDFSKIWRIPARWLIFRVDERLQMFLIAATVGICAGLAALFLNRSIEALFEALHHLRHHWWAIFLPAAGAALSSLFLNKVVKEGAGHGIPEVIYSVSRYGGLLRFRSSFSRLISSCLTIGSGGSAGPEAPVVMSGAAIGSNIARLFSLNDRQRVTLVGCGAAGAIASIFNAPIAGIVFSMEVILGVWKAPNIIPIAISAVAGTEISRALKGNQIVFSNPGFDVTLIDIPACIGLAVMTAIASILLTRAMKSMHYVSDRAERIPKALRAAIGGLAVGLIALLFPVVLGEGYHPIQEMIGGVYSEGLTLVAVAVLAKILATSLTLGWGGSGGIFAPSLVIGSLVGLSWHRLLAWFWPDAPLTSEGGFALFGMAGVVSGMLQAPLTGIFLIVEITGGYDVILPLIIVSAVSASVCHYIEPASIYLKDLVEQGKLLRPGTDQRVLADLSVHELIEKDCICVHPHMPLRDFIEIVKTSRRNYFPVEDDKSGKFLGLIHLDDVRPYLFNQVMYDAVFVEQIMNTDIDTVHPDDDLAKVLDHMDTHRLYSLPVVSENRFVGMISKATLLDQYRKELMVQTCE